MSSIAFKTMDFMFSTPRRMLITFGILIALLIAAEIQNEMEWKEFAQAHACRVIGKSASSSSYVLMSNGKMGTVENSGTTTYRCDDGIDYTR
jgi:hypothetical protein